MIARSRLAEFFFFAWEAKEKPVIARLWHARGYFFVGKPQEKPMIAHSRLAGVLTRWGAYGKGNDQRRAAGLFRWRVGRKVDDRTFAPCGKNFPVGSRRKSRQPHAREVIFRIGSHREMR